jgi:hypothetical protein
MRQANINPDEALEQIHYLKELTAQTVIRIAHGYPFYILWGILWIFGYLGSALIHGARQGFLWLIISLIGLIGCVLIDIRLKKQTSTPFLQKILRMNIVLAAGTILMFILIFFAFRESNIIRAYLPFQIGIIYIINGILVGSELIYVGIWLAFAALVSLWMPAFVQNLWFAAAGGGGLIVSGILLKKQVAKGE